MGLFAPAVVCDLSFKPDISAGLISLPTICRNKPTRFCRDSVFQERPFLAPLRHIPLYLITICSKKLQLSCAMLSCAMIFDPEKGAVNTEHSSHRHGLSSEGRILCANCPLLWQPRLSGIARVLRQTFLRVLFDKRYGLFYNLIGYFPCREYSSFIPFPCAECRFLSPENNSEAGRSFLV